MSLPLLHSSIIEKLGEGKPNRGFENYLLEDCHLKSGMVVWIQNLLNSGSYSWPGI